MSVLPTRYVLLRARLERFSRAMPGVETRDVQSVHRTRVSSRRLRELLPVLQLDGGSVTKLSHQLRKVTRRLGRVREADVMLLLIAELHESGRFAEPALRLVRDAARATRDEARADMPAKETAARLPPDRAQARPCSPQARGSGGRPDAPRLALGARRARQPPGARAAPGDRQGRLRVSGRAAARGAHRAQEAALRPRARRRGARPEEHEGTAHVETDARGARPAARSPDSHRSCPGRAGFADAAKRVDVARSRHAC